MQCKYVRLSLRTELYHCQIKHIPFGMHIQEMNAFLPFGNQTSKFEIPPFIVDFPSKKTPINYRIFLIATFDYQRATTFNT